MLNEPKAEVNLTVTYLGKEYVLGDELDVSFGLGEAMLDMIAALDYDISQEREKRLKLKATLRH